MIRHGVWSVICLLVLLLILSPLNCIAAEKERKRKEGKDPAVMAVDAVVARPLGFFATVAGAAFFVVRANVFFY